MSIECDETIANLKRARPCLWIHISEADAHLLLQEIVPESVKVAVYESTEEYFQAQLIANSEKPTQEMKAHAQQGKATAADRRARGTVAASRQGVRSDV